MQKSLALINSSNIIFTYSYNTGRPLNVPSKQAPTPIHWLEQALVAFPPNITSLGLATWPNQTQLSAAPTGLRIYPCKGNIQGQRSLPQSFDGVSPSWHSHQSLSALPYIVTNSFESSWKLYMLLLRYIFQAWVFTLAGVWLDFQWECGANRTAALWWRFAIRAAGTISVWPCWRHISDSDPARAKPRQTPQRRA